MLKKNRLKLLFAVILILGLVLLVYMILIEDEPGALPLLLALIGALGLIYSRFKST
ncbi:hypothetical protein [Paucihalobacter ruber]|uniref:hypothetical protein n=1 Tax=Paucihalobacter ruber TaxID=2567861 RepID=UPI001C1EA01F|nr:hypothetical protein [Paucihalobacter ruber]